MKNRALGQWIEQRLATQSLRAKSLIVTLFGDMIAPRGGAVGLAGFIRLVEPFGINDRLVRTSVFRLSREKWLVSQQIGRRSYYSVAASGRRRFELGAQRFYADPRLPWDGAWRLVFLPNEALPARERDALRRRLIWEGFAAIAPGVLAHPSAEGDALVEILQEANAHDRVVVMSARSLGALSARPLKELVDECWNLGAVAAEYRAFVDTFRPVARALRSAAALDPDVVLAWSMNDTPLPVAHGGPVRLLVPGWAGIASTKWIVGLTALDRPFDGFWNTDNYVVWDEHGDALRPVTEMPPKSLIVHPEDGARLAAGAVALTGWAWSGYAPIRSVEISTDGGSTWRAACLDEGNQRSWRRWTAVWDAAPGHHRILARATDERGLSQPRSAPWNAKGYLMNSVQQVTAEVTP